MTLFKKLQSTLAFIIVMGLVVSSMPLTAFAANTKIRQEINIIDEYVGALSGAYATSSAIVSLDSTKYTSGTYYLEVVASTTAGTNATVSLVNASTGAVATSVTVNGTSYALYRSSSFTPPGSPTDYTVRVNNEAVGKGIIAARIVILQDAAALSSTQTQIEIGNKETYTSISTSTLSSAKYWLYDSTKWNGSPTFYAEVTYARTADATLASSTTYNAGTYTVVIPANTASTSIQLWGGGGSGGGANGDPDVGGGAAGGQYAKSTFQNLAGISKTLVVAASTAGTTSNGSQGATSAWDTNIVVAAGGAGGLQGGGWGTGSISGAIGTVVFAGGSGASGLVFPSQFGGGGGEGAGSGSTGGDAVDSAAGTGTDGGDGGAGRASGNGAGTAGTAPGGGGGGARANTAADQTGGAGAAGRAIITNDISQFATTTITLQEDNGSFASWTDKQVIVSNGTASSPTRVRSTSFSPTSGRHYRIVFKSGYNGATFAIYNAKIVVDQTSPTKLEPQYLLANTRFFSGTALQKFLTSWASGEWTSTNTYIHQVDSLGGGSVVELNTAAGTQLSGSSVTANAPSNLSSSVTMPADGNLDVKATTNTGDVFSSRILVQAEIGGGGGGGGGGSSVTSRLRAFSGGVLRIFKGAVRLR